MCIRDSIESWNKLPDDLKQLVQDLIDKWTQAQHEFLVYQSILALDKFKEYGCEVYKLPVCLLYTSSYQEACRAIEIGKKIENKIGIYHISCLGIYRLCADVSPEIRNNYVQYIYCLLYTSRCV